MPFEDLEIDPLRPAVYRATTGDAASSEGGWASVAFEYVAGGSSGSEGGDGQVLTITSTAEDPSIGWSDPEGVQAVARAILAHFTGHEPDQALLEALVTEKGDEWTAEAEWTLTVAELRKVVDHD